MVSPALPPAPQWVLNLDDTNPPRPKSSNLPDPPGYTGANSFKPTNTNNKSKSAGVSQRKGPSAEEMETLKMKKAWEIAIAPAKQLPMSFIGAYMSGNSLQIFSIMMVFMLFKTPISAIMAIQQTFAKLESESNSAALLGPKLVFVATNLLSIAFGLWKVNGMGLLPHVVPCTRSYDTRWLTVGIEQREATGWHGRRRENHRTEHSWCSL